MTETVWDYGCEPGLVPEVYVSEVHCDCGALYTVYARGGEHAPVECSACGGLADGQLPALALFPGDSDYDEAGSDVQVVQTMGPDPWSV